MGAPLQLYPKTARAHRRSSVLGSGAFGLVALMRLRLVVLLCMGAPCRGSILSSLRSAVFGTGDAGSLHPQSHVQPHTRMGMPAPGDTNVPLLVHEPDCATARRRRRAVCRPREVWALRNGGPSAADMDAAAAAAAAAVGGAPEVVVDGGATTLGGARVSLRWSDCQAAVAAGGGRLAPRDCEEAIAQRLLAGMPKAVVEALARDAWGPRSGSGGEPRWTVFGANGERIQSWGGVLAAPAVGGGGGLPGAGSAGGESAQAAVAAQGAPVPLYVVPEGRLFVWPSHQVGHSTEVPGVLHNRAPDAPGVTVQTLAISPRIFRVRNFLSAAEADGLVSEALSISDGMYSLQRSGTGHMPRSKTKKKTVASTRTSENAFVSHSTLAKTVKQRAFELLRIGRFSMQQSDGVQVGETRGAGEPDS
jgi:hypothetical protein